MSRRRVTAAMIGSKMTEPFVTIVFVDVADPGAGVDRRGGDAADSTRRMHFATLRRTLAEHGGREIRPTDAGLMVAFPSAVAAVRCAIDMQRRTTAAIPVLSVGLDAGEPHQDGESLYGTPVIVASRLCEMAKPGEILASDLVCQIARPRVPEAMEAVGGLRLRDVADRVAAHRVQWQQPADANPAPEHDHASPRPITVVVADDERLLRSGFRVILEAEADITVIGEAPDGRTAVDIVTRRRPDVVLMDIRMPELDGLQAAERILTDPALDTAVLMLTTFDRDQYVYEALRIGASGFLLKDTPADRLLDAVRVAAAGDALLAPSITRRLIEQFTHAARPAASTLPAAVAELTSRELDVLRLVARGLSNAEIANELTLGENTIRTHVAHLLNKLGLRDRVQAVVLAYETRLIVPDTASRDGKRA
jgi:DNA-binding NarL/FixJ family response regulator/class 3 adenylate cyclase